MRYYPQEEGRPPSIYLTRTALLKALGTHLGEAEERVHQGTDTHLLIGVVRKVPKPDDRPLGW